MPSLCPWFNEVKGRTIQAKYECFDHPYFDSVRLHLFILKRKTLPPASFPLFWSSIVGCADIVIGPVATLLHDND